MIPGVFVLKQDAWLHFLLNIVVIFIVVKEANFWEDILIGTAWSKIKTKVSLVHDIITF